MAPRTAKAKKNTEISEAPKKGRGKAKAIEETETEPEIIEPSVNEKVTSSEKKKRGKKAPSDGNGVDENGKGEEAPPAKKGRKKAEEPVVEENTEPSGDEDVSEPADNDDEDYVESNGDAKESQSGRGRKKQGKKGSTVEKKDNKSARSRKAKADVDSEDLADEEVEKPKPAPRGRGRKAPPKKVVIEDKEDAPEPTARGRKKAPPKKEKTPESDVFEEEADEEVVEEPKKKETKGKKNQTKKGQAKNEDDDSSEETVPASKKRKAPKKEEKGKGDANDEEEEEAEKPEPKPKGRRGKKAAEVSEESLETGDAISKRRRKAADDKAPKDKKDPAKNKATTDYNALNFSNTSKTPDGKDWNFKISSWNVDGLRAWMSKGGLDYLSHEKPDILCLQEVKCSDDKLPAEAKNVPGYHAYWLCSEKDGYAGVGIFTTQLAMNVHYGLDDEELDSEGRIITAEYEQFYLICTYVPNAGRKLVTLPKRLQWNDEFRKHVMELDKKKPVIICGDMNVSHKEIDLTNPKTNRKNAGFTDEERAGMTELLGEGFVDTFRHLYPDERGAYTFWTYMMNCRAKNVGWRLDYFIVSERLLPALCDNVIRDKVYGSDHCPISLFLHLKGADKPKE